MRLSRSPQHGTEFAASHWLLVLLGWLTLIVGMASAGLVWAGIGQRLGEYR